MNTSSPLLSLSTSNAITQSTALAMLQYYTREATHTPYVSLNKCGITNINDTLLSALSQLPQMLSLDLSNNEIVSFPSDTDLAMYMPQLRALDLSHNPIEISESLIHGLQQLRELHALRLSLPSNSKHVFLWIVQSLPQLRFFNGVKINQSYLVKDDASESLHGIKIKENVFTEEDVQSDENSNLMESHITMDHHLQTNNRYLQQYHNGISTTVDNNNNNNNNDTMWSVNIQKKDEKTSMTREVSFLQQSEHPQLSLLSVLCIIQRMAWRKQRREEERRRQNLLNTQTKQEQYPYHYYYYYETMIQYMFVFFVEQYCDASETEIVSHIMEFMRSLHYYAKVEKCVEAYVFLQILNNKIEESYWFLFESLCTTISDLIEHIVCLNISDHNLGIVQSGINNKMDEQENSWIRHCTHHGFLCKEHVFRIIDALIPISQRDSLLHIDIVENVIALLTVSESDQNENNNNINNNNGKLGEFQSTTITTGCLLRCLCEVFVKHHERSIKPIVKAFYTVSDIDSIGVINLPQLRDLLQNIDSPLAATSEFFTRIHICTTGPLTDAPITFSAVVEATRHLVRGSLSISK